MTSALVSEAFASVIGDPYPSLYLVHDTGVKVIYTGNTTEVTAVVNAEFHTALVPDPPISAA
jgi:hypothetical protein